MRATGLIFLTLLCLGMLGQPAFADKRVALVVGNSAYQNVARLDNPKNDATLLADTLRDLGFLLVGGRAQADLDKNALDRAVQSFGRQIQDADVALFYYAGHGVQINGSNYLVPVDANPTREADVDFQMLDVSLVLRQMQLSGTKLNLVVLDACRNNPFGGRGLRAATGGLAQMRAPEGTLISYATQPGGVAQDGVDGNSPYSKALAATMRRGGLDIFQTFNEVGLAVKRSTNNAQEPWLASSPIGGSFYFKAPALPGPAAATAPGSPAEAGSSTEAERAWSATKDTTSRAILEDFIRQFGHTVYGSMARARLDELKGKETASATRTDPATTPTPAISSAGIPTAVLGDNARLLGRYADWQAYTATAGGKKVCFALAGFSSAKAGVAGRTGDNVYAFVSTRPADKVLNEFSVATSYRLKAGPASAIEIGQERFAAFGQQSSLWIVKADDEKRLIESMRHNPAVTIWAVAEDGSQNKYAYSLNGFTQALDRVAQECH